MHWTIQRLIAGFIYSFISHGTTHPKKNTIMNENTDIYTHIKNIRYELDLSGLLY